jgi:serine/threonine protein kinase
MGDNPPLDLRQLPLPIAAEIDRLCDRFGAEWAVGRRPRAEDYLKCVDEELRAALLVELLRVELEVRRAEGEEIAEQEFLERFPGDKTAVAEAFQSTVTVVPCQNGQAGPERIGKYQVVNLLGAGGQAQTYLAFDPDLKRRVVLKLYHRAHGLDQQEQVLKEGRALARVQSPYLARCFSAERDANAVYLVMEYVPGRTLDATLRDRELGVDQAVRLVEHVAEGLKAIHAAGLLHRDLKPSNILIGDDGMPRLIDFGLAAPLASDELHGMSGSLPYMSPEQARGQGERVDARTDVFGLGAVLYELITGRPPYHDRDPEKLADLARRSETTPPRELKRSIPKPLERLCLKALAADPAKRFGSADELNRALRRYRQRPWWIAGAGVAAASVLGIISLMKRFAPPAGAGSAVSSNTSQSDVALPSSAVVEPIRIVRFDIEHLADRGGHEVAVGKLGEESFVVRQGDDVTIEAELSEPAYCYLIAFRPDGVDEVFQPEDPETPPRKTRSPRYPPESRPDLVYRLAEGSGLHSFAVVVSRAPLPPYRRWRARRGSPPWQKGLSAAPGVVWWYDSRRLSALIAPDRYGQRGQGATVRGGGTAVATLAAWLKADPAIDAVAVKAFSVPPVSGP